MPAFSAATSAIALRGIGSSKSFERRGASLPDGICRKRLRTTFTTTEETDAFFIAVGRGGMPQLRRRRRRPTASQQRKSFPERLSARPQSERRERTNRTIPPRQSATRAARVPTFGSAGDKFPRTRRRPSRKCSMRSARPRTTAGPPGRPGNKKFPKQKPRSRPKTGFPRKSVR